MLRRQRAGALQRPESSFRRRGSRFRRRTACAGPQAAQAAACIAGQNAPSAKCLAAEPRSRNRRKTRCNKTDPPSPSMLYLRRWLGRRLGSASVPPHIPDVATAKAANRFPSVEREKRHYFQWSARFVQRCVRSRPRAAAARRRFAGGFRARRAGSTAPQNEAPRSASRWAVRPATGRRARLPPAS